MSFNESNHSLPSVQRRLAQSRPSRELLEYYRTKLSTYETEFESLNHKLDQYKQIYDEEYKLQRELAQRDDEIAALQKALSDMQAFLFQEREHGLKILTENDALKIREFEDRKKIQRLLALSGPGGDNEVTYFLKEPPAKAVVTQKRPLVSKKDRSSSAAGQRKQTKHSTEEEVRLQNEVNVLTLKVEALTAQLEDQSRLAQERLSALEEEQKIQQEESDARQERDSLKIKSLTQKLHKTQDILYDNTKDMLAHRNALRDQEKVWMQEKDSLLRELDDYHQQRLNITVEALQDGTGGDYPPSNLIPAAVLHSQELENARRELVQQIEDLKDQLEQSQRMGDMYREQVIQLEDDRARLQEEGDMGRSMFQERSERMAKRLQESNKRYTELEKRRKLEVEGFKNDIKILRTKMKDLEKQLFKVTLSMGDEPLPLERPDDIDLVVLRNVRKTAGRSKKIMDELKNLKAKMYSVESDLRHL